MPQSKRLRSDLKGVFHISWLDHLVMPIFVLDPKGKILYVNKAIESLLGHEAKTILGRAPDEFVVQNDSYRFLKDQLRIFRGESILRVQYDIRQHPRHVIRTVASLMPVMDVKTKKAKYVIGMVLDTRKIK